MNPAERALEVPQAFAEQVAAELDRVGAQAAAANPQGSGPRASSPLSFAARYVRKVVAESLPSADIARLERRGLMNGEIRMELRAESVKVKSEQVSDSALAALYVANGGSAAYSPGAWQRRFLGTVGMDFGGYMEPQDLLVQLAAMAVRDRVKDVESVTAELSTVRAQVAEAAERAQTADALLAESRSRAEELEAELSSLRLSLDQQAGELIRKDATIDFLRVVSGSDAEPPEDGKPRARRTKVKGETGIYRTSGDDIEIGYLDADRVQRWEILGDVSVEDARAVRAERAGKPVAVAA